VAKLRISATELNALARVAQAGISLKRLPRRGWSLVGVREPESVADHSYSLALLSMLVSDLRGLDVCKMTKMALLHDLAEAFIGDRTPAEKKAAGAGLVRRLERVVLASLMHGLRFKDRYLKVFDEYVAGVSREARMVHLLDRVEMGLEAYRLSVRYGGRVWRLMRGSRGRPGIRQALQA